MESNKRVGATHIMVLPFHSQGHINPMLQFSKRLASKGPKVTLVIATTTSSSQSMHAQTRSINFEIISEGFDRRKEEESLEDYLERFRILASQGLTAVMEKHNRSNHPAKILIYDSVLPWAQDLAEQLGLAGVPFFTQSCAVSAIYYHFYQGVFNTPLEAPTVSIPSMPLLCVDDLPSFINVKSSLDSALLTLVLSQFSNFQKAKWILFNTFDKLEDQIMKWMANQRPIMAIGPTVPSMYLDKRLEDDRDYGLSLFQQNVDTCITWLDTKGIGSVVYVSFGSLASLGEEQMEELAWGLKRSNTHFMWVVRELEKKKLPNNFIEETSEKGLVVSWCCQLEVLAHKAVGCFMTHCGWNSTLEALSLGVPMIAIPRFSDQTTNSKFVEDVWQVGVRVKADEKGIVKREEIEMRISEIMEGESGNEMKRNAERWKELAKEAVNEGGSSDKNVEEFVTELFCSSD